MIIYELHSTRKTSKLQNFKMDQREETINELIRRMNSEIAQFILDVKDVIREVDTPDLTSSSEPCPEVITC